jgi:hypothetical protein
MLLGHDVLGIAGVVVGVHALGVRRQIDHLQRAVGIDDDLHGALDRGRAVVVLDAVLGAIERAHVGAAAHVVQRHVQFEVGQAIAQKIMRCRASPTYWLCGIFLDELSKASKDLRH